MRLLEPYGSSLGASDEEVENVFFVRFWNSLKKTWHPNAFFFFYHLVTAFSQKKLKYVLCSSPSLASDESFLFKQTSHPSKKQSCEGVFFKNENKLKNIFSKS